ncbi:MAG TPA: hypothetical protein VGD69_01290 [Herpetosiphonaceae bacterium]
MLQHSSTHTRRGMCALLALAVLALTLALIPSATLAAPVAVPTIDIAAARALPLGSTVTVKGAVTVPSGVFSSSTFDQGFAIQDRSGGIYVSIATNLGLALRRQVRVTGQLAESFGQLILVVASPADVKILDIGPKVAPQSLSTGAISEATEGLLVTVSGTITRIIIDLPYGYQVFIDDGSGETQVFVCASTGIDVSGWAVGQPLQATGYSGQFAAQYEVLPRGPSDVQIQ